MILYVIWGSCLLLALHIYLKSVYSKFSKCGIKYLKPIPFFGNSFRIISGQKHFSEDLDDLYNAFPEEKFVGRFNFLDPAIIIKDIELIKNITIKDFEHFVDHKTIIHENSDPLIGRNLFSLKGREWKDMRSTLSPAFTSSKIRAMVPSINEVGAKMIRSLTNSIKGTKNGCIDVDTKDLATRFTNDVIVFYAFGLKVDSHNDRDNELYKMGKEVASFNSWKMVQIVLSFAFPNMSKKFKVPFFSKPTRDFFKNLVLTIMKDRELKNTTRLDMIHLLMKARKGISAHDAGKSKDEDAAFATVEESADKVWSDTDLIAQAILFFIAGFETVSTVMVFLCHELAINPEIQEKLFQEIKKTDAVTGGDLTYDMIQKMTYMDMVISELLRLWSPDGLTDRTCIKDYNLGRPNDKATQDYIVRKGEDIFIAVWQIHKDPKYFPDPLKFDPERFSEENKHKIKPFTYMPFGFGPRNCIGSRFALCEVKIMAYHLIKHFVLTPSPKTMIPARLSRKTFNIRIEDGHWVRCQIRN